MNLGYKSQYPNGIGAEFASRAGGRSKEEAVKYFFASLVVAAFLLGNSYGARAQTEITLLAPTPIREPLEKSIAAFEAKTGDNADKVLVSLLKDEDCIHSAGELPAGPFDRILDRVARFCEGITAASPICSVNTRLAHRQKLWTFFVQTELLGE